jgi:peptidoglycan/xylan/chitin deacetylase (PgdA/CDA1 family)
VYHGVGSDTAAEGDLAVTPEVFAEHLAVLRAARMSFVTASDVAAAFAGGPPLPARAVMISFDDGRRDAVIWATPLLRQAGARATMFTITGAADDKGSPYYAGWADLDQDVWDLQSHTASLHGQQDTRSGRLPALTSRAPGESRAEWLARVRSDLDQADEAILQHTDRPPVAFAYPFGAWGVDRTDDPAVAPVLAAELLRHYRLAFHQDEQDTIPLAGPDTAPMGIRRLEVGDWSGRELLDHIVAAARRSA